MVGRFAPASEHVAKGFRVHKCAVTDF
ncbi:hypothetical protein FHW37_10344 [Neorhizobium alkalisoli]|uniref:Uncharacterized protein n=1 Tax=Neorhizobium alkalisoli TaxID=528178 RepID=A0A561QUX6_9HYPH|nr:hypothetical protein FHW37_10344 [Neorhizobium alkalisoli]